MNSIVRLAALTATAVTLATGAALAVEQPLSQLLAQGYTIVGTDLVPSEVGKRATGNDGWADELLLTLERGSSVAFCHVLFAATVNVDSVSDVGCFVPSGTPPATSSSKAPSGDASSTEAPSSEASPPAAPPAPNAPPPADPAK